MKIHATARTQFPLRAQSLSGFSLSRWRAWSEEGTTTTASEGPFTFSNLSLADDIAILINLSRQAFSRPFPPPIHAKGCTCTPLSRFIGRDKIRAGEKFRGFPPRSNGSSRTCWTPTTLSSLWRKARIIICHSWKSSPSAITFVFDSPSQNNPIAYFIYFTNGKSL